MFSRVLARLEEGIISLLLVVMTFLVFTEVVLRFGFNTGMVWADELTLHLSAWMVLLGASYGVKVGSHIGVDVLVKLLPTKGQRLVSLLAVAACLAYCVILIDGSWVYLRKMVKIGIELDDIPIPKWLAHSVLIIGFGLLFIRFAVIGWELIQGKRNNMGLADEAREALEAFEEEKPLGGEAGR